MEETPGVPRLGPPHWGPSLPSGSFYLFPQFLHLNRARGKVTAVTSSRHWGPGESGEVAAVNHGWVGMALESYIGEVAAVKRGGRAIHWKRGSGGS